MYKYHSFPFLLFHYSIEDLYSQKHHYKEKLKERALITNVISDYCYCLLIYRKLALIDENCEYN